MSSLIERFGSFSPGFREGSSGRFFTGGELGLAA
jgi:hypothetical protein